MRCTVIFMPINKSASALGLMSDGAASVYAKKGYRVANPVSFINFVLRYIILDARLLP